MTMTRLSLPATLVISSLMFMGCEPDKAANPDPNEPRANLGTSSSPSTESPRPNPGTAPDPSTETLPEPILQGNCPSPAELMNAQWVKYEFINAFSTSTGGQIEPNSIITDKAAWDALRSRNTLGSRNKTLPEWEALPYPNVAVLSVDKGLGGCALRLGGFRVTKLNNTIHFDRSLDLYRSFPRCQGVCGALFAAYTIVSFENKNGLATSQCLRVQTECPGASLDN